jgi:threonine synthase
MEHSYWRCTQCSNKAEISYEAEFNMTCPQCSSPLELGYRKPFFWKDMTLQAQGIARYAPLIPVSEKSLRIATDHAKPEFFRPVASRRLSQLLGVAAVYLLAATTGPSGTFKDAEAAVVIAKCLDWNIKNKLSWHSTGNTARAYREYAIRAGFSSNSYFPLQCLEKMRGVTRNVYNSLIAYDGPFQEISGIAKEHAKALSTLHLAPLSWKIEGKATLAYSIFENVLDANVIVQTIAGGYGILGLQLGIERLKGLGLHKGRYPRYELFQIEGADTISRLMPLDREIVETDLKLPVNPFEPTLQSTNPLSTFNMLRQIIKKTGSVVRSVSVEEVNIHRQVFEIECQDLGVDVSFDDEKSPFISWAGLVAAANNKQLMPSDKIVIIITGSRKRLGDLPKPDSIIKRK